MSAKLLHALSEENPDLQKQIGCMTGIFQLFDRHHILAPKRIASYSSHKRPPSGHSQFSNHGDESHNVHYAVTTKEKSGSKNANETHRISMESARESFSSSTCSSSFSSVEYNKPAQSETSSFDRSINCDLAWREPAAMQTPLSSQSKKSSDFRDMVKDSIYRETRSLSVKTSVQEEPVSHAMKHRDSPRPIQISKSVNGSFETGNGGKHKVPVDLKDSLNVLAKLQETPRYMQDTREPARSLYEARERSSFSVAKDSPRFSYDGRETPRSSFESGDNFTSTTKLRELPRLSLDSRATSMKGSDSDVKSNSFFRDFQQASGNSDKTSNTQLQLETHKQNHSVVARLMGLEAMPKSVPLAEGQKGETKLCFSPGDNHNSLSRPLRSTNDCKQNPCSPRSSLKETVSPRLRNPDPLMKPLSTSRFPIEPAPWKQMDGVHAVQKPVFRNRDSPPRGPIASPSVYAEIEKRLKELEFKQSDRDLRALKQILDAMQAKGLLESKKKEDQDFVSERNFSDSNQNIIDQNPRVARRSPIGTNVVVASTNKVPSSPRMFESPIVIMKPARYIEKSAIPASSVLPIEGISNLRRIRSINSVESKKNLVNDRTAKDLTPRLALREVKKPLNSTNKKTSTREVRPINSPARSQHSPRENMANAGRSSGSLSPRLQPKKISSEKQSRPSSPSSDLSKARKVSLRQATDSGSPSGKRRPRSPSLQQNDDRLSEISGESRIICHQGDEVSLQSDSNGSFVSQNDIEVTSSDRSGDSNNTFFHQGSRSPSKKVVNNVISSLKPKKSSPRLSEDGSEAEFLVVAPEQPSPVSVLDASFYSDDLPSPERKLPEPFKVDYLGGEAKCRPMNLDNLLESKELKVSTEINRKKLESVEQLVQKLRRLNSNHNEDTTDYIASLCENTNPDHRYISEILLASGLLLRDLGSGLSNIQVHKSGYPVNPDLFLVLEQTKASNGVSKDRHHREEVVQSKSNMEKVHRKLVFDSVNEVLEAKLASHDLYHRANKLAGKTLNGQQLLKELCSEVEQLQTSENSDCGFDDADDFIKEILCKDVTSQTEKWVDFSGEHSAIVLDVERSIFKDLVDEVISGEALRLQTKTGRRCRQLFVKHQELQFFAKLVEDLIRYVYKNVDYNESIVFLPSSIYIEYVNCILSNTINRHCAKNSGPKGYPYPAQKAIKDSLDIGC